MGRRARRRASVKWIVIRNFNSTVERYELDSRGKLISEVPPLIPRHQDRCRLPDISQISSLIPLPASWRDPLSFPSLPTFPPVFDLPPLDPRYSCDMPHESHSDAAQPNG
jgi:hypothetical protein